MSKYALITGANKGIGFELARQLGYAGYKVILTTRFTERGEEALENLLADELDVRFVQMDVSDKGSIREAFKSVAEITDKLDILINNAGILVDANDSILEIPESKIFQTLHTNAIGALIVTRTFYPLMPRGSRVIMMSSVGGSISSGVSTWAPAYCVSKTTLNAITLQLAEALKPFDISINAVCPGWVKTSMGGESAPLPLEKGAETPMWLATEAPAEITGKFFRDKKVIPW